MTISAPERSRSDGTRPLSVESLKLNEVVTDVIPLLESAESPSAFFAAFIEKVKSLTHGKAVAVWMRSPKGTFEHAYSSHWNDVLHSDAARAGHKFLLEDAAAHGRTVWLSLPADLEDADRPATQDTHVAQPKVFLFSPIFVSKGIVGLLEVALAPVVERDLKRFLTRLATELAGIAAAFVQKVEWVQLQESESFLRELAQFSKAIHQSLAPTEVAFTVAQEGKKLIGCDQLAVAIQHQKRTTVAGVSGALAVERNSSLVRLMAGLLGKVAAWGETLVFEGTRDESLPPAVLEALDRYLAASNPVVLVAQPLRDPANEIVGVLMSECYDKAPPVDRVKRRLNTVAEHATAALANARDHDSLPLQWLTRPLAHLRRNGKTWSSRSAIFVGLLAAALVLLTVVRLPNRMEASGQLMPRDRHIVYATSTGKVLNLTVRNGDRVEKGQELLYLEDHETQLKVDHLLVKMSSLNQRIASLDEQLGKSLPTKEHADLLAERIKALYELNKSKAERDLILREVRNPRKAPVVSPLSGRLLTFDLKEKLVGKTVKPGDPLLRVADVAGPWEVELYLPEHRLAAIREALSREGSLPVHLLVASDPGRSYGAVLTPEGLGGETLIREDKVVLPARVTLTDKTLLSQLTQVPVGVDVQARIVCGDASLGYVWFSEVWDLLYRRFIF